MGDIQHAEAGGREMLPEISVALSVAVSPSTFAFQEASAAASLESEE